MNYSIICKLNTRKVLNMGALMFQIHMKPAVVLLFGLGLD